VNIIEFNLELTATVASLAAIRRDTAAEPSGRSILIDIRAPWILCSDYVNRNSMTRTPYERSVP